MRFEIQHDSGAGNRLAMMRLRSERGYEGVGIFWAVVELLAVNDGRLSSDREDINIMARSLGVDCETLTLVITAYGLFDVSSDGTFSSSLVAERMTASTTIAADGEQETARRRQISDKRRAAANARWAVKNAEAMQNDANADANGYANADAKPDANGYAKTDAKESECDSPESADISTITDAETPEMKQGGDAKQCKTDANAFFASEKEREKEKPPHTPLLEREKENVLPPTPSGGESRRRSSRFSFSGMKDKPAWVAEEMATLFAAWLDYKRSRGSGYANEKTAKSCYDRLMTIAAGKTSTAAEIVSRSIANNWQGLFPIDSGRTGWTNPLVYHQSPTTEYKPF